MDREDAARAVKTNVAFQVDHSVEADVTPSFAWNWQTDIGSWHDPPAEFSLDGPFAAHSGLLCPATTLPHTQSTFEPSSSRAFKMA